MIDQGHKKQIIKLNKSLFGNKDEYSFNKSYNDSMDVMLFQDEFGEVISYLIYEESEFQIEGLRSGVHEDYRKLGLGVALYKRLSRYAGSKGKPYKTYIALNNYASINAHAKAGMKIYSHFHEDGVAYVQVTT